MEFSKIKLGRLELNKGQIPGLPKNPRKWSKSDLADLARSMEETPELAEARGAIVVKHKNVYVVLGGNMRVEAARSLGWDDLMCAILPEGTPVQTLKAIVLKDNSSFGAFDVDLLHIDWAEFDFKSIGLDFTAAFADLGLTTKGKEKDQSYQEFEDKFKPKLTTDDCYTPPAVYEAVLSFVKSIANLKGKIVERPFVPGGDYINHSYRANSVVVDNPPFSILSEICRFYCSRKIPFFLFAPQLTLFTAPDCDLTYIISDSDIEYENGAKVRTGFVTNMIEDIRIWCCPELRDAVIDAQDNEDKTKKGFVYPDNIVTSAILGKVAKRGIEFKVPKVACEYLRDSDSAKDQGRGLYGGGFIMSDRAAAERAAAERAAATRLNLSDREKAIIERLNQYY